MKKTIRFMGAVAFVTAITFTSCKKDNSSTTDATETEMNTHVDDQAKISEDMDDVTNDLSAAVEANADFAGARLMQTTGICGAQVTADTANGLKRVTIIYQGNNCQATNTRSGMVQLTMPLSTKWKDAGAVMTVTYHSVRITRKRDNKFITLNGTHTLTNVTGGLLRNLANSGPITHTLRSNDMSITFPDSSQRKWEVYRKRDYTFAGGVVVTISGLHSTNGQTGIAEWGTDRFGRTFTTAITQPIVIKQDCGFRVTSGQIKHNRVAIDAAVTYGLDAAGNATGCPGLTNPYYFKLTWTGLNGNSHSKLFPY